MENPYTDARQGFWEMCVQRDVEAFLSCDWSITEDDFDGTDFLGIDACGSNSPADWIPKYPTLDLYRQEFDRQAKEFDALSFDEDPCAILCAAVELSIPQIQDGRGLIVKTFRGSLQDTSGAIHKLEWRSIFHMRQTDDRWRFTGFVGYLPLS